MALPELWSFLTKGNRRTYKGKRHARNAVNRWVARALVLNARHEAERAVKTFGRITTASRFTTYDLKETI